MDQTDSHLNLPAPAAARDSVTNSRVPTLTEIELYSISPERLEPRRRDEVAKYVSANFLQGQGNTWRMQASAVIQKKAARFVRSS